MMALLRMPETDDSEMLEKQREVFRRQLIQQGIDMPPGDYMVEATYAPIVDGMWKGKLQATAKIRIGEQNDPLARTADPAQGK